jgi:EAL domain-containing protein (putative c-di-GMP-specific phosphodiesterase class I)
MEHLDVAITTMKRLRAMGVDIHIDDFGTGYSSLSYLQSLPIDALKIDRSFINKLTVQGNNQEIITSIISLAKSLNFEVIAEGVETDHQLDQIKEMNCQFGQGFLIARPMPPAAIDAWIETERQRSGS